MKLSRNLLALATLAALAAPAAHAEVPIDVIADSEISFEGMLQADFNWFNSDVANLNGDAQDGRESDQELRRAELVLKGKGPGNIEWVVGYDAKADKWLDTNVKYKIGGNGNHYLQFGQFKQPNSLEELSSTKSNDFISKATITNTFAVGRRVGVAYGLGDSNWGVTASVFGDELKRGNAAGNGFGVRGYFAPVNAKGNILHLGLSHASYDAEQPVVNGRNLEDTARFRARSNADLAGVRLVDTGNIPFADKINTTGLEAMWVRGPVKLQGEYMRSKVGRSNGLPDFTGDGAYVSALWNLTGETWGYKGGTPSTPLPDEPATGMWQLGARYDKLKLDDAPILGGEMSAWTLGVNWYWRSNFKFAVNYVMVDSERKGVSDNPNILGARAQFYW